MADVRSHPLDALGGGPAAQTLMADLHRLGWSQYGWPADYGGKSGTALHRGMMYEAVSTAGLVLPWAFSGLESIAPALIKYRTPGGQTRLDRLLRGQEYWALALSEPDAGSDIAAVRTRGEFAGSEIRINGQKIWSSLALGASYATVLVRTGEQTSRKGLTMLFVDLATPGVTIRPIPDASGWNDLCEVYFEDVMVPADAVIGQVGGGWNVALDLMENERGLWAWQRQGILNRLLRELLEHGALSIDHGALGEVAMDLAQVRARAHHSMGRLADGQALGVECSIDKVLLAKAEQSTMNLAKDALGGRFVFGAEGAPWRSEWFHSRTASIYGGALEIQLNLIAERVLGLPREPSHGRK
jgi:alkylation response protein AidB-like acyl-CoA dehydrogenase